MSIYFGINNILTSAVLNPSVARPTGEIISTLSDKGAFIYHDEMFQLPDL